MDHLELLRKLPARLVALGLSVMLVGCVTDEQTTASFDGSDAQADLPSTVAPTVLLDRDGDGDGGDGGDGEADPGDAGAEPTTSESTTTTEPLPPLVGLGVEAVADGFDQPILVTGAPGSDRLFVVERKGVVRTVGPEGVDPEPFLDLRDRLLSSSIEQGLLGLAFHPDFEDNRTLFAYWTDPEGDSMLARFTADPAVAGAAPTVDPASMNGVLRFDQPAERHNAGGLLFGPDGLLYVSVGDGGTGGSTGQDTSNLLGTILRLDVSAPGDGYAIPAGNPFDDEIWVYGLRNPWRFWIDEPTGLVYIGDVGQERYEEINVVGLDGAGTNFGWFITEGDTCFRSGCDRTGLTDPVLQYGREDGCSVTGGIVYRGSLIPEFDGHYFYADWCKGFVRSMRYDGARVHDQFDWTDDLGIGQVTSFGVDNSGEIHLVTWDGGLHRLVAVREG